MTTCHISKLLIKYLSQLIMRHTPLTLLNFCTPIQSQSTGNKINAIVQEAATQDLKFKEVLIGRLSSYLSVEQLTIQSAVTAADIEIIVTCDKITNTTTITQNTENLCLILFPMCVYFLNKRLQHLLILSAHGSSDVS